MNVLSLFDGISCARVAIIRAGIPIRKYYASEIDPHAITVSTRNFPDTIHLGDVKTITKESIPVDIDLLIGGSPCLDLSIAKANRKGLEGDQSSLFYEYARILREIKPRFFILENVASMPSKDREIITREMGVQPILIDAALVSAQSRKRLFWTNIPVPTLPKDRGILLKDVLQSDGEVDDRFITKNKKSFCLTASYSATSVGEKSIQHSAEKKKRTVVRIGRDVGRRLNENGTREDGNKSIPIQRRIELREDEKTGTLTSVLKDNLVVSPSRIRKLTPIECERLQSLPDNYTEGVPITHRYRCLGNAFNVEVIVHLLKECL